MNFEFVTKRTDVDEQLLYFTSSSLSADGELLFFIAQKDENPNLYVQNLNTGDIKQLSDNTEGVLKAYVYFRGNSYRGLGKGSVALDNKRNILYYLQGSDIMAVDIQGNRRKLAQLPPGQMTAFTHVSGDGKYICVPTTDEKALEDEDNLPRTLDGCGNLNHDIDLRVQRENLNSYLRVYSTETGEQVICEQVNKAWITHVQFSPVDSTKILYNHEWPADCGIRRMWLFDTVTKQHIRLREENEKASRKDWTCHEMWQADGKHIIYHGAYADGINYIGRVSVQGGDNIEISLPKAYDNYGHFTAGTRHKDLLVCDGNYIPEGCIKDAASGAYYWDNEKGKRPFTGFITVLKVNWQEKNISFHPLCETLSSWRSQDCHPHPIFDTNDECVYFTSDAQGKRDVCRVKVSY